MRQATLSEKLLVAVPLLVASCGSDHHVSPWGSARDVPLRQLFQAPDLGAQLARLDRETASLALALTHELRATLPLGEGDALIRGYEGVDALGRAIHAVRVVTPRGIVMAVGPIDPSDTRRDQATELVPALIRASDGVGAYRSGTDLNGDGRIDVVVRSDAGALSIWHVGAMGAAPYEIEMLAPPERAVDLDEDGRIDLVADLPLDAGDAIAPRFSDVATFSEGRYSNRSEVARAHHARLAEPEPPALPGPPPRPELRLRAALERAFHAALAAKARSAVLDELDREAVPPGLKASFDRHRARIAALFSRGRE